MIISTSSHSVLLSDDICQYAEVVLWKELQHVADHVVSVDVMLDANSNEGGKHGMHAVVRIDLLSYRSLVTEILDNDPYAAIRRSARDAARAIERQVQHSRQVTRRMPERVHSFGRLTAPNV